MHGDGPTNYPSSGLTDNYCRNPTPETEETIWCYTTDVVIGKKGK